MRYNPYEYTYYESPEEKRRRVKRRRTLKKAKEFGDDVMMAFVLAGIITAAYIFGQSNQ